MEAIEQEEIHVPHENNIGLIPVRPGVFFALWDFSSARVQRIREGEFSDKVRICLFNEAGEQCSENLFVWNKYGAYISHEARAGRYYAKIYVNGADGWVTLAESNLALSPAMAGSLNERSHASLEFHKKRLGS